MDIKELERYLDKAIILCDNPFSFSLYNTLIENNLLSHIPDTSEQWSLSNGVIKYGVEQGYLEIKTQAKYDIWVGLTKLGLDARSTGGYFKFKRKQKKKSSSWNSYNTITLISTIVLGILTIYFNSELKDTKQELELYLSEIDSLKTVITDMEKDPIDTLNTKVLGSPEKE